MSDKDIDNEIMLEFDSQVVKICYFYGFGTDTTFSAFYSHFCALNVLHSLHKYMLFCNFSFVLYIMDIFPGQYI